MLLRSGWDGQRAEGMGSGLAGRLVVGRGAGQWLGWGWASGLGHGYGAGWVGYRGAGCRQGLGAGPVGRQQGCGLMAGSWLGDIRSRG